MTPEQESQRADDARLLLENPLFIEAFQVLRLTFTKKLMDSPARDSEGREKLYVMNQLLGSVKHHFESIVNNGVVAKRKIFERNKHPI